ncbi:MAG: hypothetical protein ACFCVE_14140 [Phycisphaerae bacterium]
MPNKHYFPNTNADLRNWLVMFADGVVSLESQLGITPEQVAAVEAASTAFDEAMQMSMAARAEMKGATDNLKAKRRAAADVVRPLVDAIQANPACTNQMRTQLHITVPKEPSPAPMIEQKTSLAVRGLIPLGANLSALLVGGDRARGKPAGATGVQVVAAYGPTPPTPEDATTVYFGGKTRFTVNFPAEQNGRQVTLWARYYNDRHTGPWSEPLAATVVSAAPPVTAAAGEAMKIAA